MKKYLVSLLFALTVVTVGTVQGQGSDVALVNLLSGDVTYVPQSGMPGKMKPFMKVMDGDRINVAVGAQVRIVFFEGNRQELWLGPSAFLVGKTATESISGKVAEVNRLPVGVPQRMARIPELIKFAQLGGMQVRGLANDQQSTHLDRKETLDQAKSAYETMRQEMPANDIAPELYLYAVLYDFRLYGEMKAVIAEMQRKQPDNADAKALDAWLTARMSR